MPSPFTRPGVLDWNVIGDAVAGLGRADALVTVLLLFTRVAVSARSGTVPRAGNR
jgi:hypothetical protein